jgi:hypothetical protein
MFARWCAKPDAAAPVPELPADPAPLAELLEPAAELLEAPAAQLETVA